MAASATTAAPAKTYPCVVTYSFDDPITWMEVRSVAKGGTVTLDLVGCGLWGAIFSPSEITLITCLSGEDNGSTVQMTAAEMKTIVSIRDKIAAYKAAQAAPKPSLNDRINAAIWEDAQPLPAPKPVDNRATTQDVRTASQLVDRLTMTTRGSGELDYRLNQSRNVVDKLDDNEEYCVIMYYIPDVLIPIEGDDTREIRRLCGIMMERLRNRRMRPDVAHPCPNPASLMRRNGFISIDGSGWFGKRKNLDRPEMKALFQHWEKYRKQGLWFFSPRIDARDLQIVKDEAQRRYEARCAELAQAVVQFVAAEDAKMEEEMSKHGLTSKELEKVESDRHNDVRARLRRLAADIQEMQACHAQFDSSMAVKEAKDRLNAVYAHQRDLFNAVMEAKGLFKFRI